MIEPLHGRAYTLAIEVVLAERGWVPCAGTTSWHYPPSTPPGADQPGLPSTCGLRPTEINPDDATVFPPGIFYEPGLADEEVQDPPFWSAQRVCGLDDTHLAGVDLLRSVELPGDEDDVIDLLDQIEAWRWPHRLPAAGFGGSDHCYTAPPADLPQLSVVVAERLNWVIEDLPYEAQPLCWLSPLFTYEPNGARIRANLDGLSGPDRGYFIWANPRREPVRHVDTAVEVIYLLDQIEAW